MRIKILLDDYKFQKTFKNLNEIKVENLPVAVDGERKAALATTFGDGIPEEPSDGTQDDAEINSLKYTLDCRNVEIILTGSGRNRGNVSGNSSSLLYHSLLCREVCSLSSSCSLMRRCPIVTIWIMLRMSGMGMMRTG